MRTIRIGSGAGYSGDRIEPAVELAEKGDIDYLVFECLGERTVALAQQARLKNPEARLRSAAGGADARGAAAVRRQRHQDRHQYGRGQSTRRPRGRPRDRPVARPFAAKVAAVVGDDVLDACKTADFPIMEFDGTIRQLGNACSPPTPISAPSRWRRHCGGADVVITGRASDPALFLAPMIHAFGWPMDDWNRWGRASSPATCWNAPVQVTGGYFADPGVQGRSRSGPARLSHRRSRRGWLSLVITKVQGSGGAVTAQTCKEQLLYEVHDPDSISSRT